MAGMSAQFRLNPWGLSTLLLLGGCVSRPVATTAPSPAAVFVPGVEGRSGSEVCNSTSPACQRWTELARKCEDNLRQREAGYMGRQIPYCDQAETYREQVTGVGVSSASGAYDF